jgi:hypothetical protein
LSMLDFSPVENPRSRVGVRDALGHRTGTGRDNPFLTVTGLSTEIEGVCQ